VRILMSTSAARQALQAYRKIVDDPEFVRWQYQRQPVVSIPNDPQRPCLGDPNAPNTVVAFIEMQCTACMAACDVLAEILHRHPTALRVDFRHFPLDSACNEGWPRGGHPASCQAALAAEAARVVGGIAGFQKMRTLLHQHRHELQRAPYVQWAAGLGLEPAAFSGAMASDQVASRVRADIALGKQLGVEAVPVLFLNGRRLDHWSKAETWETLLGLESPAPTSDPAVP
jgi:protein-disulfide isomerase